MSLDPQPELDVGDLATVAMANHGRVLVATLTGELDISNVETIGEVLNRVPNEALGLVVDLSDVRYLDSSAISLLHNLATRLGQRAQDLVVVCRRPSSPYRVLTLTGFDARAPMVDDVREAIARVREPDA